MFESSLARHKVHEFYINEMNGPGQSNVPFTLSKGLNVCYLKTANYTHHRVNKSAGLISGLVELEDDHDAGV